MKPVEYGEVNVLISLYCASFIQATLKEYKFKNFFLSELNKPRKQEALGTLKE